MPAMTPEKASLTVAREARRLAVRALDRAEEAVSIATGNRSSIQALEARLDASLGQIAMELGDIRESIKAVLEILTARASG